MAGLQARHECASLGAFLSCREVRRGECCRTAHAIRHPATSHQRADSTTGGLAGSLAVSSAAIQIDARRSGALCLCGAVLWRIGEDRRTTARWRGVSAAYLDARDRAARIPAGLALQDEVTGG